MKNLLKKILPSRVKFDTRLLHPAVSSVVQNLQDRNYQAIETAFDGLSIAEISLLNEGVSDIIQQDDLLDHWFDEGNGPPLAALLRGTILRKRAWFYRGSGGGDEVGEEKFAKMFEVLRDARRSLSPILDHPQYGSEACARMINVYKGLQEEWEDIDEILKQMWSFGEINLTGEIHYLIACCEKWFGSHRKMFRFAEKRIAAHPEHPELGALMAAAHYERHMFAERFDENQMEADKYRENPNHLNEITQLRDKLLAVSEPGKPEHILAHNIFAGVASGFFVYQIATPSFLQIGERFTPYPWIYMDDDFLPYAHKTSMGYKKQYLK